MKKSARIEEFIGTLGVTPAEGLHECYLGYFACFNRAEYYEAHDVLEHLWLQGAGANHAFFKGLIQFAGAFVHLQKQYLHPTHPKHGRRLRPAVRLFKLALANLEPYSPHHLSLDIVRLCGSARVWIRQIEVGQYERNPWSPGSAPRLALDSP